VTDKGEGKGTEIPQERISPEGFIGLVRGGMEAGMFNMKRGPKNGLLAEGRTDK